MNNEPVMLKEIQLCELKILIYFRNFCESNGLKYFITAGTLLGAVRHGGFIPWDDDVAVGLSFFGKTGQANLFFRTVELIKTIRYIAQSCGKKIMLFTRNYLGKPLNITVVI